MGIQLKDVSEIQDICYNILLQQLKWIGKEVTLICQKQIYSAELESKKNLTPFKNWGKIEFEYSKNRNGKIAWSSPL